jgi:hypothetical protein
MALSITQQPDQIGALAQSPIIFTVSESNPAVFTSSSFSYVGELYYWTGSATAIPSTPQYTIQKYPNNAGVGIFDLNRIINSTLTHQFSDGVSKPINYKPIFYTQFLSGSTFVTGSKLIPTPQSYRALDGYAIFPTPINTPLYNNQTYYPYYPMLTAGPATQSVFSQNQGDIIVDRLYMTGGRIEYSGSNGQNAGFNYTLATSDTNTDYAGYPQFPSQATFPLSGSLNWYTIRVVPTGVPASSTIRYNIVCNQKYPNVRIKWKNQFGAFDYFNFNMVNRQSFQTEKKTYQPQLGTWESSTFSYNAKDSANLNYIVDSKQTISVNTDWVDEDYNEIFKQLLVSDEIYLMVNESSLPANLKPLTITTSNIQFKTGVVDKLIQYQFDFLLGQNYKLIM